MFCTISTLQAVTSPKYSEILKTGHPKLGTALELLNIEYRANTYCNMEPLRDTLLHWTHEGNGHSRGYATLHEYHVIIKRLEIMLR